MEIERILNELRQELVRISQAISAVEAIGRGSAGGMGRGRRRMSAETRRRIAEAAKKRWAARKKAALVQKPVPTHKKTAKPAQKKTEASKRAAKKILKTTKRTAPSYRQGVTARKRLAVKAKMRPGPRKAAGSYPAITKPKPANGAAPLMQPPVTTS
jgi:hypothetical protein